MNKATHITDIDLHAIIDELNLDTGTAEHLHFHADNLKLWNTPLPYALHKMPNARWIDDRLTDNCMSWLKVSSIARERYAI